jgi:tripartite-type tricarboxylate transporter receptor subunit TctC
MQKTGGSSSANFCGIALIGRLTASLRQVPRSVTNWLLNMRNGHSVPQAARRSRLALSVSAVLCCGPYAIGSAAAQDYPVKPITIIVPFAPGGASDVSARITARQMSEELGQPIIIENRAGASGMIAMGAVARATPDGYTIGWSGTSPLALAPFLTSKPSYDPLKSFSPIGLGNTGVTVLLVSPSKGYQSMKDVIARAKASPGKLSYGSSGVNTSIHLTGAMFASMAGIDVIHVPFKGGHEGSTAVTGGHVDYIFDALSSALPLIKSGQLKALAVSGTERHKSLPDVPTIAEAGLPGFEVKFFLGLVAPAQTPPAVVNKLSVAMRKALAKPGVREQLEKIGADPASSTPEEFRSLIEKEIVKWRLAIKAAGVTPE